MNRATRNIIIFLIVGILTFGGVIFFSKKTTILPEDTQQVQENNLGEDNQNVERQDENKSQQETLNPTEVEYTSNIPETIFDTELMLRFPLFCYNQRCQMSKEIEIKLLSGEKLTISPWIIFYDQEGNQKFYPETPIELFSGDLALLNSNIAYTQQEENTESIVYSLGLEDATYSISVNERL